MLFDIFEVIFFGGGGCIIMCFCVLGLSYGMWFMIYVG